jgi:hypothetical protein
VEVVNPDRAVNENHASSPADPPPNADVAAVRAEA